MGKKLFVSNIDFEIKEDTLRQMFMEIGPCVSVVMAFDRETKRSKGFAFVELEGDEDAKKAIELLNNKVINGRPMKVTEDRGKGGAGSDGASDDAPRGEDGRRRPEFLPPMQRLTLFKRKKKTDIYLEDESHTIDYKDTSTLSRFLSERGKILSRRLTGLNSYNQRKVAKAIKRSQNLGLMGFTTVSK